MAREREEERQRQKGKEKEMKTMASHTSMHRIIIVQKF